MKIYKRFLSNYGKILPSEFIPQLKSMPPTLTVSNLFDSTLPKIEGYHSEQDSYIKNGSYFIIIISYFYCVSMNRKSFFDNFMQNL